MKTSTIIEIKTRVEKMKIEINCDIDRLLKHKIEIQQIISHYSNNVKMTKRANFFFQHIFSKKRQ